MQEIERELEIASKNYLQVLEIIKAKGGRARVVGGAVRDALLGHKACDVDITTDFSPKDITEIFTGLGYNVIPTGIKFGTVSLLYQGEIFQITTLRKDLACDGRRAKVEYTSDFYLDALRRDFTINALSYDPFAGLVYDYFTGLKDLEDRVVRFIGDPELRIKEDYLRILRFFRFFGRFGDELDQNALSACINYKRLLKDLSRERIKAEFDLILSLPNYLSVLALMKQSSILQEIFPLNNNSFEEKIFVLAEKTAIKFNSNLTRETKYALLFLSDISLNDFLSLKFSRLEAKKICFLLALLKKKDIDEYFLKKLWIENNDFTQAFIFIAVMLHQEEKCEKIFLKLQGLEKPLFPINGNDMSSLGFSGSELGLKLAELKQLWINSDFQLSKYDLIKIISK